MSVGPASPYWPPWRFTTRRPLTNSSFQRYGSSARPLPTTATSSRKRSTGRCARSANAMPRYAMRLSKWQRPWLPASPVRHGGSVMMQCANCVRSTSAAAPRPTIPLPPPRRATRPAEIHRSIPTHKLLRNPARTTCCVSHMHSTRAWRLPRKIQTPLIGSSTRPIRLAYPSSCKCVRMAWSCNWTPLA